MFVLASLWFCQINSDACVLKQTDNFTAVASFLANQVSSPGFGWLTSRSASHSQNQMKLHWAMGRFKDLRLT
jgi:hypothetical protein